MILHPLPQRFGTTTHIIYDSLNKRSQEEQDQTFDKIQENINDFEPKRRSFDPNNNNTTHFRIKRRINSIQYSKIPQNLFVETAIFVDRDLFRHMAQNYPKNTEGNLIRFILSMINGVRLLCFVQPKEKK